MCANYVPVTSASRLLTHFGVEFDRDEKPLDVFPTGLAPVIRLDPELKDQLICENGIFGLLPHFATEVAYGRRTYNARTETVHQLASFRQSWAQDMRCVIPAEAFYEPSYESGEAVRYRINLPDDKPMGIAGVYRHWKHPNGNTYATFAMLTVNADGHPVMQRFHKPGDEKRMVVILQPDEYLPWLTCSKERALDYFKWFEGELLATPAPLPPRAPRAPRAVSGRVVKPPVSPPPQSGDLFG